MSKIDARLPKGMRDFLPGEVLKREYVIGVITDVFQTFGFEPIYTPALEMLETLLGKGGEEADKLIYNAHNPAVFAVAPVHEKVKTLFAERGIAVNYSHVLKAIDPGAKRATYATPSGDVSPATRRLARWARRH